MTAPLTARGFLVAPPAPALSFALLLGLIFVLAFTLATESIARAQPAGLSPSDRERLRLVKDRTPTWDDDALYPLLKDALTWSGPASAGPPKAAAFDWDLLDQDPAGWRGQPFLVVGEYPRKVSRNGQGAQIDADNKPPLLTRSDRPGPWEGRAEFWSLVVEPLAKAQRETKGLRPRVAIVLLTHPPAGGVKPGQRVEAVARFYKMLRTVNQAGEEQDFPLLVGHSAAATWPAKPTATAAADTRGKPPVGGAGLLGFLVFMGVAFFLLRRRLASAGRDTPSIEALREERRRRRAESRDEPDAGDTVEPTATDPTAGPLPTDPALALEAMRGEPQRST